ncbi:chemotaxis protein CheA [Pseudodesulfovibrio piezophilus]|uniref:Chemotaxis protein CheA n=1 Tax=Pseudodesulfovibrio piezophilus (strain DSM 21447 / JCM 15486 / C1TLV30) TaxID=1322246 RepID=M1WUX8_PSEP2|nr:chemotaxis protein CheA [Pseudodesulfovibrio piezophilus]CCH47973.1 CheA signal transduction histidine kinase [Pseudodesulfovibrio piezophilus C1TLV30]
MSQDFLDPEILADFFVEAKEHLETIEPNLLELEKSPENLGLLNEIFRPMHSLKGASGFLGLNKINGLAHKAENILDELRQGSMHVTGAIMDLILSATDALRTMVDNLENSGIEGDVDTTPIIADIEKALAGELDEEVTGEQGGDSPVIPSPGAPEATVKPVVETVPDSIATSSQIATEPEPASPAVDTEDRAMTSSFQPQPDPNFDDTPYILTTVGEGHLADFLEEAQEIVENLNRCLLALEGDPDGSDEMINDTFRYFHNLKGNSGIIGFKELNALTHEAETLLNKVRKGDMECSQGLIDLLLAAVDLIEELIGKVDMETNKVSPVDTSVMVQLLQKVTEDLDMAAVEGAVAAGKDEAGEAQDSAAGTSFAQEHGYDQEDVTLFVSTINQQLDSASVALELLRQDATQMDIIDALFRTFQTIQNSTGYMGLNEIKEYASRTAGLVDQGRKSDIDFTLMLDILDQEFSILKEMLLQAIADVTGEAAVDPTEKGQTSKSEAESESSAPKSQDEGAAPSAPPAPAPTPQAAEVKQEPVPSPAPVAEPVASAPPQSTSPKPTPAPASQPAPKSASPAASKSMSNVPSKSAANTPAPTKPKGSSTIRVDHHKLDHLMNVIGELIINRNRYAMLARALEEGHEDVHVVAQQLTETTYAMARISDDLQDTIMKVRMVPVQTVFSRFPRLVRDLSRKSGKQVELIMEGEETEFDKSVVEEIGDPLVHLVRNAVDHGLEDEQERVQAGKKPKGHVWLRAYHKGNSVAIEVEDDGRGIDPDKLKQVAIRKGVITPEEANAMDDREALDLIFAPGFSSAEKVTDISGRGVGMDVVKTNIKNLKGSVNTQSEVGKGTRLTLTLPLTLAIIDALMVQVAGDTFAIPLDAVSETTKIEFAKLSDVNNRKAVTLRGEVLGIVELAELLGLPQTMDEREVLPMVVIQDNDRRLGLVVDRLLERQEIVIKPLGQYLNNFNLKGLSGATIMGDGSVVLILDPHEIYSLSTQLGRKEPSASVPALSSGK